MKRITLAEAQKMAKNLPLSSQQREKLSRDGYQDYFLAERGEQVSVEDGSSYFGSGGYGGAFYAAGAVERDIAAWDNGFVRGERGTVTFAGAGVVSCVAGDGIGDGRTFHSYIALCVGDTK